MFSEMHKEDFLVADVEELEKGDASEINPEESMWKNYWHHRGRNISYSQKELVQQNCQEETTNSENPREQTGRSEVFSGEPSRRTRRVSSVRIKRRGWSPVRLLVESSWFHLSSSQWTSSSTPCAERRNIPNSTEIHWCDQGYFHLSGCVASSKNVQMSVWMWTRIEVYQILGQGLQSSLHWKRETSQGICGRRDWETSKSGREVQTRQFWKVERHLFHRCGRWRM